jgi:dTDP-4-amino-4,6-dideoxygalactose transaminase
MRIPLTKPSLVYDEVEPALRSVIDSGTLTAGENVVAFEEAVAGLVGTRHAVATTSATTALHLVLAAAGVGPGDEVLVSDFTYPATGNAIAQTGATPVLVDSAPGSFCLDLAEAEAKMTTRTRALIVVDPFGEPADLEHAAQLAAAHGLLLIEDAACALGAERDGRWCGSWPGAACFSFHPRKIITTGEGGMVTTNDDALADRLRLLRNHGGTPVRVGQAFAERGFNYRLSELAAALGRVQLLRLDELVQGRREAAAAYGAALAHLGSVDCPPSGTTGSTFQSYVVVLSPDVDRDDIVRRLATRGIETTLGTYAMHSQPAFAKYGYRPGDLPRSWSAQQRSLTLPLWPGMPREIIAEVVHELGHVLGGEL